MRGRGVDSGFHRVDLIHEYGILFHAPEFIDAALSSLAIQLDAIADELNDNVAKTARKRQVRNSHLQNTLFVNEKLVYRKPHSPEKGDLMVKIPVVHRPQLVDQG